MSVSVTDETIYISLPTIPYLTTQPVSVTLPTSTFKTVLRLVVIISTYLLFRPQLERLFKRTLGQDDPAGQQSVEGLKNRMKELENETGKPIGGGRKAAIVTGTSNASAGQGQGQKARRKA